MTNRISARRWLILALLQSSLITLSVIEQVTAQMPSDLLDQTKTSVVLVLNYNWLGQLQSYGSGFLVRPEGLIITNQHVILNAARVRVRLADGRMEDAHIVKSSDDPDLALLLISETGLSALSFAPLPEIRVLDYVVVVGYPLVQNIMSHFQTGIDSTVTDGKISRIFASGGGQTWLQVTAPINPGNSGGPLLNTAGQVVGVATASYTNAQGFFFAIASDTVEAWIQGQNLLPQASPPAVRSPFDQLPPAMPLGWNELLLFLTNPLGGDTLNAWPENDLVGLAYQRSSRQLTARFLLEYYARPKEALALGFELFFKGDFFIKPYLGVGIGLPYVRGLLGIEWEIWFLRLYAEITYNRSLNGLPLEHRKVGIGVAW